MPSNITGLPRKDAKNVNFAKIYGAGVKKFAQMIGRPENEAKAIYAQYDRELPFICAARQSCPDEANREGFIAALRWCTPALGQWAPGGTCREGGRTVLAGRGQSASSRSRAPWYRATLGRSDIHTALNALIQGTPHAILSCGCAQPGAKASSRCCKCTTAWSAASPARNRPSCVAQLACDAVVLQVPMRADIKFGRNWGDAQHTSWQDLRAAPVPDSIVLPLASEPPVTVASIPFMITRTMREQLHALGVCEQEIAEMTPQQAHARLQQAHICVQCRLDPPDGDEVCSPYNEMWLHPRCQDAFIRARMADQNITWSTHTQPGGFAMAATLPEEPEMPPPQDDDDDGGDDGAAAWQSNGGAREDYPHGEREVGQPVAEFIYHDQNRKPYLKVCKRRTPDGKKSFPQYHWEGGRWQLGKPKGPPIPYRLPELLATSPDTVVWVCEGEKDADTLVGLGLVATTNPEGAGKWSPELNKWFAGRSTVVVLEDNDEAGRRHAQQVATALYAFVPNVRVITFRDLPEHGDVTDWLQGTLRSAVSLHQLAAKAPQFGEISADPYTFPEEADIPAWDWLYARHLLRGEVSGTAAQSGTGKSSLSIGEGLAMTSGKALLRQAVPRPLRVVLVNLEDSRNTMDKRIAAVMRLFGLTPADIGDRLIIKAKGEISIKVARVAKSGKVERNRALITALIKLMQKHRADVLSIDSFVRTHEVNESDNSMMLEVVECFEEVAAGGNCAVHLWHHTRKAGSGEQITVASARGASAIADAFRSYRMLETMSLKEHEQLLGIAPDMLAPGFYFRGFNGKRNFAPPAESSDWFRLENLTLRNGDEIGVAKAWTYPASVQDISAEVTDRVVTEIDRGMPGDRRFSNHNKAREREVWPVVQKHCPNKTEAQCRAAVTKWVAQGRLYTKEYHDPVEQKKRMGLYARPAPAKQAEEEVAP